MRRRSPSLANALLILLLSLTTAGPESLRAAAPEIVIGLGDSIAAGTGSTLPRTRSYPALVGEWLAGERGAPVSVENLAVSGETASSFISGGQRDRFQDSVAQARLGGSSIALVTVSLGGNEMLNLRGRTQAQRQAGLDSFVNQIATVLTTVRDEVGLDTPVVATTYYDLTDGDAAVAGSDAWWVARFNEVIRSAATEHGIRVAEVGGLYRGRISDYTHAPYDVHPTNAGHLAIARAVWAALEVDTAAPTVNVLSSPAVTRVTPTIRFRVTDGGGVASVEVDLSEEPMRVLGLAPAGEGEYVALVDLEGTAEQSVLVTIVVTDQAGNVTRTSVELQLQQTTEARP